MRTTSVIARPPSIGVASRGRAAPNEALLAAAVLAALAASTPAQALFGELRKRGLPPAEYATSGMALGDVDGDGDLDLVSANGARWQNRLYLNDGTGQFTDATAQRLPPDSDDSQDAALGDVDGDGDLDLVFANSTAFGGQQNKLYLNDGAGRYTDVTAARMPVDNHMSLAVTLGDVDGDGDLDMLFANSTRGIYGGGQQNRLYLNDGTGRFTDATATQLPSDSDWSRAAALGDVDGDGDLDLSLPHAGSPGPDRRCGAR